MSGNRHWNVCFLCHGCLVISSVCDRNGHVRDENTTDNTYTWGFTGLAKCLKSQLVASSPSSNVFRRNPFGFQTVCDFQYSFLQSPNTVEKLPITWYILIFPLVSFRKEPGELVTDNRRNHPRLPHAALSLISCLHLHGLELSNMPIEASWFFPSGTLIKLERDDHPGEVEILRSHSQSMERGFVTENKTGFLSNGWSMWRPWQSMIRCLPLLPYVILRFCSVYYHTKW